jgi:hypothetical protein
VASEIVHPGIKEDNLDAAHNDAPLRVCSINDEIGDAAPLGCAHRVLDAQLNLTCAEEPSLFCEAKQDVMWRAAMLDEVKEIEENNT